MTVPMLLRKTFATNSLVQNFLYDIWFGRDANYSKIKSTPNDSYIANIKDNSGHKIFVFVQFYNRNFATLSV